MPTKKEEATKSAKYLLYLKLLHDGTLSEEDSGAYEQMQAVYGFSADETLSVRDWWDSLLLELDCSCLEEFEGRSEEQVRSYTACMIWPAGALAEWMKAADLPGTEQGVWYARVMLRLHRADTSGLVDDVRSSWGSLQSMLHLMSQGVTPQSSKTRAA